MVLSCTKQKSYISLTESTSEFEVREGLVLMNEFFNH